MKHPDMPPAQLNDAANIISDLSDAAPTLAVFLVLICVFLFFLWKMFHAWRTFEEMRDERMEKRHQTYFGHLDHQADESREVLKENTKALGKVHESNRGVQEALRRLQG